MPFYAPVQNARAFRIGKSYDQIDWSKFRDVIDEFHRRIDEWYIKPAKELGKNGYFAFSVMAINCLLVDTLSQYYYGNDLSPTEQKQPKNKKKNPIGSGALESSGAKFKDFLVERLKHRTGSLPTKITTPRGDLLTYEDVLWSGFRCGILHEAHIPLYGAIYGVQNVLDFQPTGFTKYANGADCPTVICFPQKLRDELEMAFLEYLDDLWNPDPAFDDLRRRFKAKFEDSFGVTINTTM